MYKLIKKKKKKRGRDVYVSYPLCSRRYYHSKFDGTTLHNLLLY